MRAATRGTPTVAVVDEVLSFKDGEICFLNTSAIFDPQFVAYIYGFRCSSNHGSKEIYLQLRGFSYFEILSGKVFYDSDDLHRSTRDHQSMSFTAFALLLREGDVIPHWSLPKGETIFIYRRDFAELRIKDRCLVQESPISCQSDVSRWTIPWKPDKFDEEFSDTIR